MSLEINLPAIHKAITTSKEDVFDDPKQYVCIRDGHAIVMSGFAIVLFDLRTYFTDFEELPADQYEYFDILMEWLEGKNFTKSMWDELSGIEKITVIDDTTIQIEDNGFTKDLIYIHRNVLTEGIMKTLNENQKQQAESYHCIAYSQRCFEFITKTVGKYIGSSPIIIQPVRKEKPARFTVHHKHYMFGLINPKHEATEEEFLFENLGNFCENNSVE